MNTQGYISRKKEGTGLYEELHIEALEILQKLSAKVWTDYNEHDPGVTLIENIAYTLTELAHKTSFPIQDLLIQSEGRKLRSGDNGLFIASDILTTGPITFNDYRRILIDQVTKVKNVWIYPVDNCQTEIDNTKGLLHVFIEKYKYMSDSDEEKKDNELIIQQVRSIYNNQRNLCEDLYDVAVYKPLRLTMCLKMTLTNKVKGEEILAKIFYKINDYLAPEVKFYSLWKLQQEDTPVNEIFNGPHLSKGFVLDKDLKDPLTEVVISDIIKMIAQIQGVVSINDFYLRYADPDKKETPPIRDSFNIPKNTAVVLLFPKSNEDIVFENLGVLFQPDLKETKKHLSFIRALDYGGFKEVVNSVNEIGIPQGKYRNIMSYYPTRKQFPELYGIGDVGISTTSTELRKAQVKQFQAYLMPLDQLMVNFLAQLRNVYTLYDVSDANSSSYFTQELPDIDQLTDLIKPSGAQYDESEIIIYWRKILKNLNDFFDSNASLRFNEVANHLLSRFNETFHTYSLRKMNSNSYGEALISNKFEEELLEAKRKLVREYASISYNRANSFNYHQLQPLLEKEVNTQFIPGVLRKIAILMGLNDFRIKSLTKEIPDSGITIHPKNLEIELIVKEIDIITPEEQLEIIEIEDIIVNEIIEEDLYKVMHYVGDEATILRDVLKNGVIHQNYKLGKNPKKEVYYVFYKRGNQESNIAHIAKSKEEATNAIKKAIKYLVKVNQQSEGFFTIEHLLLLPPYHESHFGFSIDFSVFSKTLDLEILHKELNSCQLRDEIIKALIDQLFLAELEFSIIHEEDYYWLEINSSKEKGGDLLAISKKGYQSKETLEKNIEELKNIITTLDREQLEAIIKCNVYYGERSIDESFFSFQMSFVAPSWPVRFQSKNFKRMFENTIYEQLPIHIKSTTYWLDYDDLYLFEKRYFSWINSMLQDDKTKNRLDCAYDLIMILQEFNKLKDES